MATRRLRLHHRVAIVAVLMWAVGASAVGASAASPAACDFDATTGTASVRVVPGGTVTIARSGNSIVVDGAACEAATVANTDLIDVASADPLASEAETIVVDLSGGALAPGATDEGDGSSEVEVEVDFDQEVTAAFGETLRIIGSDGADRVSTSGIGVNLNAGEANEDPDVSPNTHNLNFEVVAGSGDDGVDLSQVTLFPEIAVFGGDGDDVLSGNGFSSRLDGGPGSDIADYSWGTEAFLEWEEDGSRISFSGAVDELVDIEIAVLTDFNDQVVYAGGATGETRSGAGFDTISAAPATSPGAPGERIIRGGDGFDFLNLIVEADRSVRVDLDTRTVSGAWIGSYRNVESITAGDGDDRFIAGGQRRYPWVFGDLGIDELWLREAERRMFVAIDSAPDDERLWLLIAEIERVLGSRYGDVLSGNGGSNHLFGFEGPDVLLGRAGSDILGGGAGNDEIRGGLGVDACRGGPGADHVVGCES